ncbi:MAG: putative quinol monooxygenase [Dermatophilaceae bacterium]
MSVLRVSEVQVREGRFEEFMERLRAMVATFPDEHEGLEAHQILVDRSDPRRVAYLSQWRDEAALIGYAGASWESEPVTFPGEADLLEGPMSLRHFDLVLGTE